jgi:hypothetical protein
MGYVILLGLILFGVLSGAYLTVPMLKFLTLLTVVVVIFNRPKKEQEINALVGVYVFLLALLFLVSMWVTAAISLNWHLSNIQILR